MTTILIVDDEPDPRHLIRLIFELAGHQVTEAPNGAVALKLMGQQRFDLVVTDVMMPVMGRRRVYGESATRPYDVWHPDSRREWDSGSFRCG